MPALQAAVRRGLDAATHPAVVRLAPAQRAWLRVLASRWLPDAERARLARKLAHQLVDAGRPDVAERVFAGTAATVRDPGAAADLAWSAADLALGRGEVPADLDAAVRRVLGYADAELRAGRPGKAAEQLARALALLFHRTLHFDRDTSPLAAHPDAFLATLRGSSTYARLTARHGGRRTAAAAPPAGRAQRVLFVSYKNWSFLDGILAHYEARDDVEVRRLELADLPGLPLSPAQLTRLRLTGPDDARELPWAGPVAAALDWADTVFCEWGQRGAALLSLVDPGDARVVVRLHSFEAFTPFPHLIDWSRVDDLLFVAEPVQALVERVVALPDAVRRHVVPNHVRLAGFDRPKDDDARFTLALVGWAAPAKDAPWALDVLGALRRDDDRWRLLLVGGDVAEHLPRYRDAVERRLAEPDVAGAVERPGHVDDVAAVLTRAGVILSTSTRESFHLGLVEGAASGAVPVVRDWPLFAPYGGARALFPDEWVVASPAEAAERIRRTCADPATWRAEGGRAREAVLARYDWPAVAPRLDAVVLGGGS